jgi:hypothetical protein
MFARILDRLRRMRTEVSGLSAALRDDRSGLGGEQAARLIAEAGAVRRALDGLLVELAHRSASERPAGEVVDTLALATGSTTRRARDLLGLAEHLERLGPIREALADGRVSAEAAQVIAETATQVPGAEARLVRVAEREGLGVLRREAMVARTAVEDPDARARRQRDARCLAVWTDLDGMVAGRFRLPPEVGGEVRALLDDRARRIYRAQPADRREPPERCAADALAELVRSGAGEPAAERARSRSAGRRPATPTRPVLHVVVDHGALVRGAALPGERCEIPGVGPVSAAWARDLLGEAFLTAVIARGRDVRTVAHLGRHVPAELRTALVVRGRACVVTGCARSAYLELDHCEHDDAAGGSTSLGNLTWLCSEHHRRKSAGARLGRPDPTTGKRVLHPRRGPP